MYIALTSAAGSIHWGDVATWVAAVGTSGSLLAGMYIILRDRMNGYRSQIDQFKFTMQAPEENDPVSLTLRVANSSLGVLYDIDTYLLCAGWFPNEGRQKMVGLHFSGYALSGRSVWTHPIFEGCDGVIRDSSTLLTTRITDLKGRTWLTGYMRMAKLVTWRTRWLVNRHIDSLQKSVRLQADVYEEVSSRDMTKTRMADGR